MSDFKKIIKFVATEKVGVYELVLHKLSKFIVNDGNILYFEDALLSSTPEEEQLVKVKLVIISENDGYDAIPNYYEYLCSFKDNAHIRYFVYIENTIGQMFGKFFKDFSL